MGVWDPKLVRKMAPPDFPDGKLRFFPRWSLWSGGGGVNGRYRSTECPRHRHCQPLVQWFSHNCMCTYGCAFDRGAPQQRKGGGAGGGVPPLVLRCTAIVIPPVALLLLLGRRQGKAIANYRWSPNVPLVTAAPFPNPPTAPHFRGLEQRPSPRRWCFSEGLCFRGRPFAGGYRLPIMSPPPPQRPGHALERRGEGGGGSVCGGRLTLLLAKQDSHRYLAPKAPEFFFYITKAHTWLTLLLVNTGHSAEVNSRQQMCGNSVPTRRQYQSTTVHFHKDVLFNVNI